MIILNLQGGLGNQIYQYNFALLLAKRLKTEIFVNDEIIRRGNFLNELTKVGIEHKRLHAISGYILYITCSIVYKFNLQKYINSKYVYFYLDPQTGYDPEVERIGSKIIFLNGYFQNHDYILENLQDIQNMIHDSISKDSRNQLTSNQVCVHVRRGDYLDTNNKDIFSKLDFDYYFKAMNLIASKQGEELLFKIFSNDIEYCKSSFEQVTYKLVFIENSDPVDDFKEMIQCSHFIIANSTFSLLASIYSKAVGNFIIAPSQWFKEGHDDSLVPKSYLRI